MAAFARWTNLSETITALQGNDEVYASGGDDTIIAAHGEGNEAR